MLIFKNCIVLCLLATLLLPPAAAQESPDAAAQTDSILVLLPRLRGAEKLDALSELITLTNNPIASKPYVDMLLAEAQRQNNIEKEGNALAHLIYYYSIQFDNDSLFIVGDYAIPFLRKHELYDLLCIAVRNVAIRHADQGRFLTALRMAEDLYEELKERQDNWQMAQMIITIALLYDSMEQTEEALRLYKESIEIVKKSIWDDRVDDIRFLLDTYSIISILNIELKRYEDALLYTDSMQMEIERLQRNYPEINLLGDKFPLYGNIVHIYAETNRHEEALMALRKLEEMFIPEWEDTIYEMTLIEARYHYHNGIGDYEKALEYLNQMIQYVAEADLLYENFLNFYKARLLFNMGAYRLAAETAFHVIERRDTINSQRFASQINELRTIYQLDRAELETERQRAKVRQQRIIVVASLVVSIVLALLAALIAWNRRRIAQKNLALYRRIKEQDKAVEKYEALEKDYKTLISQNQKNGEKPANGYDKEKTQQQIIFERLHEYLLVDRNFANDKTTSVTKLTEQLSTNRDYLYKAVKTVTGKSLQAYVNDIRVEEAKKLLDTTNKKIEEIAELCGYEVKSTFNRRFKEHFGFTPSDYRNSGKIVGSN